MNKTIILACAILFSGCSQEPKEMVVDNYHVSTTRNYTFFDKYFSKTIRKFRSGNDYYLVINEERTHSVEKEIYEFVDTNKDYIFYISEVWGIVGVERIRND